MTATLKVITNSLGSGDWIVVYETTCGETVFEGHSIGAYQLFDILQQTNGGYEHIEFYELTDDQIEEWEEHI